MLGKYAKKNTKARVTLGILTSFVILAFSSSISISFINQNFENQIRSTLSTANAVTNENLKTWINENYITVSNLAANENVRRSLIEKTQQNTNILSYLTPEKSAMVVFDTHLDIQFASRDKARAADYSKILSPENIARSIDGEMMWVIPQALDALASETQSGYPCVNFIAPIYSAGGQDLLGFVLIKREMSEFFRTIFRQGKFGNTGETYAVSKNGTMLTPSRFGKDLLGLNKISNVEETALYFKVREGGNPENWTEAVSSILAGNNSENIEGYTGYLGRKTVGMWVWNSEYEIGIVTEMQAAEAFYLSDRVSNYILIFSAGLIVVAGISIFGLGISRNKADRFLKRLRNREREIRSLVESVTEGIIGLKDTADINYSNAVVQYISGYDKIELLHLDIRDLFAEREGTTAERTIWPEDLEAVLQYGNSMAGRRLDLIGKDGTRTPVEMTAIAVRNAGSDATHVVSFRDVSGWLRVQKNMIDLKDKAEENNRAKSIFLANMSHEIRTPLNGVVGALGLLEASETDGKAPSDVDALDHGEVIKLAKVSADALLNVINDVLDISKLEEGKLSLSVAPTNVKDLLSQVHMLETSLAKQKGIDFSIDERGLEDVCVSIDEGRVRQVLLNFVSNAIKFTDEGEVNIRMSVVEKGHDATVKFEISDTGLGISKEMQERLFGRFEQADNTVTRTTTGSGLGLAISRELVDLMGGDIGVNSKEGEGSTFWFSLTAPIVKEMGDRKSETVDLRPSNILVAEDNPINKKIIEQILLRNGHACFIVENGKELLEHLELHNDRQVPYDVILMDLHMPIMGGEEATDKVQKSGQIWSDIPIIALTADTLGDKENELMAAGFSALVGKPINISELFRAIKHVTINRAPVLDATASITIDSQTLKEPATAKNQVLKSAEPDAGDIDDLLGDI